MDISKNAEIATLFLSRLAKGDFKGIARLRNNNILFRPDRIVRNFSNMDTLFETLPLSASPTPLRLRERPTDIGNTFDVAGRRVRLDDHFRERNVTAFMVMKDGVVLHEQFLQGTGRDDRRISWSVSKSIMSMLLGALLDKGIVPIKALEENVADHVPALRGSGYDGATLRHVLNMTSGVGFNEDYMDYHSDINRMGRILVIGGSLDHFATTLRRRWEPGTYMQYVSVDTHVIGMVIRAISGRKMIDLLQEHIVDPAGLESGGFITADSKAEPFVLGGLNLTTSDYARLGLVAAGYGTIGRRRVTSKDWMERSTVQSAPPVEPEAAATPAGKRGYGMQWWLPPDAEPGEFLASGIYGQFLYIHRGHGVVIVQNAADTRFREGDGIIGIETMALFRAIARTL